MNSTPRTIGRTRLRQILRSMAGIMNRRRVEPARGFHLLGCLFVQKCKTNAFTLLEILVSVAILSIMIVVLASIGDQVSRAWRDVDAANQRRSAARVLLHFMARELETGCRPVPMPAAMEAIANLQFVANLPTNTDNATVIPTEVQLPNAVFWQAPVGQDASGGGIAEIGYFLRWDTSSPGKAHPLLCRFFVEPTDTTNALNPNYLVYARNSGTASNWLSVISTVAPSTAPAYQGWLSDNVIALWVRCLDYDGVPITKTAAGKTLNYGFDSRQGYQEPTSGAIHPAPTLPPIVEVFIVVIDSISAQKLKTPPIPTITSPADFDKDASTPGSILNFVNTLPSEIKSGVEVFSTRIFLAASRRP